MLAKPNARQKPKAAHKLLFSLFFLFQTSNTATTNFQALGHQKKQQQPPYNHTTITNCLHTTTTTSSRKPKETKKEEEIQKAGERRNFMS
jgi:hypothetical protein